MQISPCEKLLLKAENGSVDVQRLLGYFYLDASSNGRADLLDKAYYFFGLAAKQGDAESNYELAISYLDADPTKAYHYFKAAAEAGMPEAQYNLSYCYAQGLGAERNEQLSLNLLYQAAEAGLKEAQFFAALQCEATTPQRAFAWYRASAVSGHRDARCNLGLAYYEGLGVARDLNRAAACFSRAAELGSVEASYNLARCYVLGEGVSQDFERACEFFERAAEAGHQEARNAYETLAAHLQKEREVKSNPPGQEHAKTPEVAKEPLPETQLARWQRLATQGDAESQFELAFSYENGEGVPQDYKLACEWYRKAADQGLAKAQLNLGACYYDGHGQQQNFTQAVEYFTLAAEQDLDWAQLNLAACCEQGIGLEKNLETAISWYKRLLNLRELDPVAKEVAQEALARLDKK